MGALQRRELTTPRLLCRQGTPSHPQPSLSQCGCSGPTGQGCSHPQPTFWGVTNTPEQGPVQGQSGDFSLPSHPTYTAMICCPPQRCPREPPLQQEGRDQPRMLHPSPRSTAPHWETGIYPPPHTEEVARYGRGPDMPQLCQAPSTRTTGTRSQGSPGQGGGSKVASPPLRGWNKLCSRS